MVKNNSNVVLNTVFITLFICLLFGTSIAIVFSGIVFNDSRSDAICRNCGGVIDSVITQNGTFSPDKYIEITGVSGIKTRIDFPQSPQIIIDNLRDITPYTVGIDGSYEFSNPQDAYNQAIADGRGIDNPAIILIGPGTYPFGSTQFQ